MGLQCGPPIFRLDLRVLISTEDAVMKQPVQLRRPHGAEALFFVFILNSHVNVNVT